MTDKITCANTYYVEGLNYNLLSALELNSLGCKFEFHHKKEEIYDADGELIGSGDQTRGNLSYLDMIEETYLVVQFDNVWLWHKRLCH